MWGCETKTGLVSTFKTQKKWLAHVIENHLDEVNCFVGLQDKESGKPIFNVPGLSKKSVTNGIIFKIFTVYPSMLMTIIYYIEYFMFSTAGTSNVVADAIIEHGGK